MWNFSNTGIQSWSWVRIIKMKKMYCIIAQTILLLWFFLDMIWLKFGDKCLVTRSYKEDGIFFLVYLVAIILFIAKENIGKWFVTGWMSMWFLTQFICHEWYTIFNGGFMGTLEGKIKYFSGTIHWLQIEGRYIPDVYHTILHILIIIALTVTIIYTVNENDIGNWMCCIMYNIYADNITVSI